MATTKPLISLIFFFSLFSLSSSHFLHHTSTLLKASSILSNSGFFSMSLTLQLVSKTLTLKSPSLTVFAPSDSAFYLSGQPSLSLLQFHLSPLSLTLYCLKSLPSNSKIPTLFPNHSIVINSSFSPSGLNISINGVNINKPPMYNDGSLIIFGIDGFFNPIYRGVNLGCGGVSFNVTRSAFHEATDVLRSKGYSVMASFLDLQLLGFKKNYRGGFGTTTALTLFAPDDNLIMNYVGNVNDYSSLFFRHLVDCKISSSDLTGFDFDGDNGVVLKTFLDGFEITVTRSDDVLKINGVEFTSTEVYSSDYFVVHGLAEVLVLPAD